WDIASANPEKTARVFPAHEGDVGTVAFSADRRWLLTIDGNNAARLWDLRRDDPTARPFALSGHEHGVGFFAISPDSRWIATAGANYATSYDDRVVRLWDLTADDPSAAPHVLLGHEKG